MYYYHHYYYYITTPLKDVFSLGSFPGRRSVTSFLTLVSAFLLVAVARDRFRKICRPLDKQRPLSRTRRYVLLCCLGSLALTAPFAVLNGARAVPTGVRNVTGVTCSTDDAYAGTVFPLVYSLVMALAFVACVAVMAVSYTRVARELWRHKKNLVAWRTGRGAGGGGSFRGGVVAVTTAAAVAAAAAAAASARGRGAKGNPAAAAAIIVVEDTSSGPRNDLASSEVRSNSTSVDIVPMTSITRHDQSATATTTTTTTTTTESASVAATKALSTTTTTATTTAALVEFSSDKDVLLLSVRNFSASRGEGPKSSSMEDSDEGCFSVSSTEVTTSSADNAWKEEGKVLARPEESESRRHKDKEAATRHSDCEMMPKYSTNQGEASHTDNDVTRAWEQQSEPEEPSPAEEEGEEASLIADGKDPQQCQGNEAVNTEHRRSAPPPVEDRQREDNDNDNVHHQRTTTTTSTSAHQQRKAATSLLQAVLTSRGGRRNNYDVSPAAPTKPTKPKPTKSKPKPKPKPKPKKKRPGNVKTIPSSTTLMMFVLTAIFVVNYLPHLTILALRAVSDGVGEGLGTGWLLNAYNVGLRSYFMNSAVNSLVYGFCSARFRQECRTLFCGRRRR